MTTFTDRKPFALVAMLCMPFITPSQAQDTGHINVNLSKSPVNDSPVQELSLFGCNEQVNTDVFWETDNQIVGNIPYRWRTSASGKKYYAAKYYLASPPVFRKGSPPQSPKQRPYIGLVTPDSFTFKGDKPAQIVYFDYRILEPTYLSFVEMDYDHKNDHGKTCRELGVDLVPVNTQCSDFPWRNGALGAAGIGFINTGNEKVFLPFKQRQDKSQKQQPLNCTVSVLADIMLDYDVHFVETGKPNSRTASLTQHHDRNKPIKMVCHRRDKQDIPSGCKPPE